MTDDPVKLAYAAGLIDGEGCICRCGAVERRGRPCMPCLCLKVSMTDECAIRWLQQTFGGPVRFVAARKPQHKPVYLWSVPPVLLSEILQALLPYLIVKKGQAERAIALRSLVLGRGKRLSGERLQQGLHLVGEIKTLNKRGRDIPNTAIS